jgi:hypothetical protein
MMGMERKPRALWANGYPVNHKCFGTCCMLRSLSILLIGLAIDLEFKCSVSPYRGTFDIIGNQRPKVKYKMDL